MVLMMMDGGMTQRQDGNEELLFSLETLNAYS